MYEKQIFGRTNFFFVRPIFFSYGQFFFRTSNKIFRTSKIFSYVQFFFRTSSKKNETSPLLYSLLVEMWSDERTIGFWSLQDKAEEKDKKEEVEVLTRAPNGFTLDLSNQDDADHFVVVFDRFGVVFDRFGAVFDRFRIGDVFDRVGIVFDRFGVVFDRII